MYCKLRNSLAGLAVSLSMLGVSYTLGGPPKAVAPEVDFSSQAMEIQVNDSHAAHRRNQSIKRQLSMPFFSFAPFLPRRES